MRPRRPRPRTGQTTPPPRTNHLGRTAGLYHPPAPSPAHALPPLRLVSLMSPRGCPQATEQDRPRVVGPEQVTAGARANTAAVGEPAGVLGRPGEAILWCSALARLIFGSMLVVSTTKLFCGPGHAGQRQLGRVLLVAQRGSHRGRLVFRGHPGPGPLEVSKLCATLEVGDKIEVMFNDAKNKDAKHIPSASPLLPVTEVP